MVSFFSFCVSLMADTPAHQAITMVTGNLIGVFIKTVRCLSLVRILLANLSRISCVCPDALKLENVTRSKGA